ncbi:CATRA system-associated protein [Actinomadura sp. WAC 06369]|uniref:CATRA system-associated protein n=1 Tax=Actinomadura sp. WAC 06369 TaxID=2203193 RepID=UPI000F7907C5|nr:CATRA system-associated protein [Actinomadura sp. WAC 06369]
MTSRARRKAGMVLDELTGRRLAPGDWTRVAALLDDLGRALGGTDPDPVLRAAAALAAASQPRVTRIGGGDTAVPCPPDVRERANVLVHELSRWDGGAPAADRTGPDGAVAP